MNQIKGFLIYIALIATVALAVFINWLKEEEDSDERVGYESGRYEHED